MASLVGLATAAIQIAESWLLLWLRLLLSGCYITLADKPHDDRLVHKCVRLTLLLSRVSPQYNAASDH